MMLVSMFISPLAAQKSWRGHKCIEVMNIYILLDFQQASEYIPHPISKLILLCVLEARQVKYE